MRARRTRVWSRQPSIGLHVNSANALTLDLQVLWSAVGNGYEAIKGYASEPIGAGTFLQAVAPYYLGGDIALVSGNGTTGVQMTMEQADTNVAASQDFTALQLVLVRSTNYWDAVGNTNGGSGFWFYDQPNGVFAANVKDSGATTYTTGNITVGHAGVVVPVWAQRAGSTFYVLSANKSASIAASTLSVPATLPMNVGDVAGGGYNSILCGLSAFWTRALSLGERLAIEANPWQLFAPIGRKRAYSIPASSGVTGTAAISEAADVAAGTGAQSVTGSATITEGADASSGVGSTGNTGAGASTESPDTASATGAQSVSGSAGITESADTAAGVGAAGAGGNAAIVEGADTATGTGAVSVAGSAAATEAADVAAGVGAQSVAGTAAATEGADVAAGAGAAGDVGAAAITESADVASGTGALSVSGSGAATESPDVVSAIGGESVTGTAAIAETADTTAGTAAVSVTGAAAATESADVAAGTGSAGGGGTAAINETPDVAAGTGGIAITGTAAAVESADFAVGTGEISITGSAATQEGADTASGSGGIAIAGAAAILESHDIAYASSLAPPKAACRLGVVTFGRSTLGVSTNQTTLQVLQGSQSTLKVLQ